jgi:5-methylcytosine-specific restriction enzyme A
MGKHRSPLERPPRTWYGLKAWRLRRAQQLREQPLCESCLRYGVVRAAEHVHHNPPHNGNWLIFVGGKVESLCGSCHSQKQSDANALSRPKRVVGVDGFPIG